MSIGNHGVFQWLERRRHLGIHPGLERVEAVLEAVGHPEQELRVIHVAGTNGKGSVSSLLASLLRARLRVGIFASPGQNGLSGEFQIIGEPLSESLAKRLVQRLEQAERAAIPEEPLTEFEALTVLSFLYFAASKVEIAIVEAGMGGRLDATNVVKPLLSVITNVSMDHAAILGHTLSAIAFEKSGIIKYGVPVVTGAAGIPQFRILRRAREQSAPLYALGVDFTATLRNIDRTGMTVDYRGIYRDVFGSHIGFLASYQVENVALALASHELLEAEGCLKPYATKELRGRLTTVQWPGRFEVSWRLNQPVILDGAHNPAGSLALRKSLEEFGRAWSIRQNSWLCVIGVLGDKDVLSILHSMRPFLRNVVVCRPENERGMDALELAALVRKVQPEAEIEVIPLVSQAIKTALKLGGPVCCFGSLYTVQPARKAIEALVL